MTMSYAIQVFFTCHPIFVAMRTSVCCSTDAPLSRQRENYPNGMFIVLVVHGDDTQCSRSYQHIGADREKTVQLLVQVGWRLELILLPVHVNRSSDMTSALNGAVRQISFTEISTFVVVQ